MAVSVATVADTVLCSRYCQRILSINRDAIGTPSHGSIGPIREPSLPQLTLPLPLPLLLLLQKALVVLVSVAIFDEGRLQRLLPRKVPHTGQLVVAAGTRTDVVEPGGRSAVVH